MPLRVCRLSQTVLKSGRQIRSSVPVLHDDRSIKGKPLRPTPRVADRPPARNHHGVLRNLERSGGIGSVDLLTHQVEDWSPSREDDPCRQDPRTTIRRAGSVTGQPLGVLRARRYGVEGCLRGASSVQCSRSADAKWPTPLPTTLRCWHMKTLGQVRSWIIKAVALRPSAIQAFETSLLDGQVSMSAEAVSLCSDLPRGVSRDGSVAVSASPRLDHP